MPDGTAIVDNPIALEQKIVVPEGKFEAPRDYQNVTVNIDLLGTPQNVELIKQVREGNCAEYTTLDTVLLAQSAGLAVNPQVVEYLANNPRLNLDTLESDFVIPFLLNAQEKHAEQPSETTDVDNLDVKLSNPYESLTKRNSMILFREALSPIPTPFKLEDQISDSEDIERMKLNELIAVFIGSSNHATSLLKLGNQYLHVDPYFNQDIAKVLSEADATKLLQDAINQPGSIVTMNPLFTK